MLIGWSCGTLSYLFLFLVRHIDLSWNTLEPSLVLMYEKLVQLHEIDHTGFMNDQIFHLKPWIPEVATTAQDLIAQIHEATPELEVLFMGAAALGLPGKNDIDLDILCGAKDIAHNAERLKKALGDPKSITHTLVAWEFKKDGFEIDCILSDPTTSHVPRQKRVFELLKANVQLRAEYEDLKHASDGLPYTEYEQRKKAFFIKVLGEDAPA